MSLAKDALEKSLSIKWHVTSTYFTSGGQTTGDHGQQTRHTSENLISYKDQVIGESGASRHSPDPGRLPQSGVKVGARRQLSQGLSPQSRADAGRPGGDLPRRSRSPGDAGLLESGALEGAPG